MTKEIIASAAGTRDVNNTCNVFHLARSLQFNTSDVLKQFMIAQDLLAAGVTLPADVNKPYGGQSGVSWLGAQSSDVLSCTWAKDVDGVVGTLSFQLKQHPQGPRYRDLILPGDLLAVFMDDAGTYVPGGRRSGTLVTVAIVDRVAEATRVQNMATTSDVSVAARDLAVVLSESTTVMDQAFTEIENSAFTGDWIRKLFGDTKQHQRAFSPLENVLILLLLLYDQDQTGSKLLNMQWKLSTSSETSSSLLSLLDVTTFMQNPMPFYALAGPPAIVQAGNVWSLLENYANTVVNEFFVDIRDDNAQERQFRAYQSRNARADFFSAGDSTDIDAQNTAVQTALNSKLFKPASTQTNASATVPDVPSRTSVAALVMRQRPYDDDAFNALPYTMVDSTEVESLEVSRSSHDVHNWFRIRFPDLNPLLQELVAGVTIAPQSIAKFGFRRMDAETIYMFTTSAAAIAFNKGSTKTDFQDVFTQYIFLLATWFSQNEFWLAGQMTMRFKPSIRIGTRLRLTKDGQFTDFYVQGVQHNFVASPGGSRSTFTLTRGRVVTDATIPIVSLASFHHGGFYIQQGGR